MIHVENINKSFGELKVLQDVSFDVAKGEMVSITGPSGAGKSTLLQIVGTLLEPSSGLVTIDGTDILKLKGNSLAHFRNQKIGFVFQFHHLLPEFNALENVMMPALIGGESKKRSETRAMELMELIGLRDRALHKPAQLSGGEQQRVAIARALIQNPSVILADEPTGNLDSENRDQVHTLLRKICTEASQTVVIVTHDPVLASLTDRNILMKDGRITF